MKNLLWTLAFLSSLTAAAPAFAQSSGGSPDASWSELVVGERVEITFRSGGTIVGKLVAPDVKLKAVDYTKEASLTLDLSEEAGTDGTMTVSKKDVKSVRKMRVEKKPISELFKPAKPASVEDPKPEKPPAPAPAPTTEAPAKPETEEERQARLKKEEEEKEKLKVEAMAFYAKFQPPFWGPDRHTMNSQKKARGQAWSAAEIEFEKDYERLWKKGQDASPKPEPKRD